MILGYSDIIKYIRSVEQIINPKNYLIMDKNIITTKRYTFAESFCEMLDLRKAYSTNGRMRRSQFWHTALVCIVCSTLIDAATYGMECAYGTDNCADGLGAVASGFFFVMLCSAITRRLHDTGRSGLLPRTAIALGCMTAGALVLSGHMPAAIAETAVWGLAGASTLMMLACLALCTQDSEKGRNRFGYSDKYIDPNDNPYTNNKFWQEYGNTVINKLKKENR